MRASRYVKNLETIRIINHERVTLVSGFQVKMCDELSNDSHKFGRRKEWGDASEFRQRGRPNLASNTTESERI